MKLNGISGGVVAGTVVNAVNQGTQGVVFDVASQSLLRAISPNSEILAIDGGLIAGDGFVPDRLNQFTFLSCITDGFFGLPPVPFPEDNWTWCTGIDRGNVVGARHTLLIVSGTVDPPGAGFTQETMHAFVNATDLGPGRALAVSGDEQVGDYGGVATPGAPSSNSVAVLWHGTPQSVVFIGPACTTQAFLANGGFCDTSSALATDGVNQGGYMGDFNAPHAAMWSGSAASLVNLHPARYTTSRVTGISTVFQAGDGVTAGASHGLLWQGSAASVVDLNKFLPPGYPFVTITGADADGEIVGYMQQALNGAPDPKTAVGVVLTPVPSMSVGSLTLSASNAMPGDTITATVTLRAPAAAGGVLVSFTSSDPAVVLPPANVLIPEGQINASVNVPAPAGAFLITPETVTLTAMANFTGRRATLAMSPVSAPADPIASVAVPAGRVYPGTIATGQVTLSTPAPAGGTIVSFNILGMTVNPGPYSPICGCNGPSVTTFYALPGGTIVSPGSMVVPAGATTASFPIGIGNGIANVFQVAVQAATGSVMKQAVLNVGPPSALSSLSFLTNFGLPNTLPYPGGVSNNLASVLTNVAAETPVTVTFSNTNPAVAMPASVTISAGTIGQAFYFNTLPPPALTTGIVTATANGVSVSAPVSVAASPQPLLTGVTIPFVSSGQAFTGTVSLSGPALLGGAAIALSSNTPAVAAVPASIVIPFGATSGTFTGIAGAVAGATPVVITAAFNGGTVAGTLPVLPGPVLAIASYTLSPYTMIGPGVITTGTITLNQPAPAGGVTLALSTGGSSAAKVPATVTFAPGQWSASFGVQGNGVPAAVTVNLTATYQGGLAPLGPVSASAGLTVAPNDVLKAAVKPTWSSSTHVLTATVTSSNPLAIVTALNANGNVPLGIMTNLGNGNYSFQTTIATIGAVNFKSNLGGSTGQGVTVIP